MRILIFQLLSKYFYTLGAIRCEEQFYVAVSDDVIWIKVADEEINHKLISRLPVIKSFYMDEFGRLFRLGHLTPEGVCGINEWVPIKNFIVPEVAVAAMPGSHFDKIKIKLAPHPYPQESSALEVSLKNWKQYAEHAPETRLSYLSFAVSENGNVFIIGKPLPPIPGNEYWKNHDIYLPSGYNFELPLISEFINKELNAGNDSVIVLQKDNSFQKIDKSYFVPARRSAIRLTEINGM